MKHYRVIAIVSLIAIAMGIFYYCYVQRTHKNSLGAACSDFSMESVQKITGDNVIVIKQLNMPRFTIDQDFILSLEVQESYVSPSNAIISCSGVKGTMVSNQNEVSIFTSPRMVADREKKIITFPDNIEAIYSGVTISGDDAYFDNVKQVCIIKKNIRAQHELGCLQAGRVLIDVKQQEIVLEDDVTTELSISSLLK